MVHIKDIAKVCGVSSATVSKALNNQPDIGEATKERIQAVAKEMGYMSNSSARALKTGKTKNIGVLFVDEQGRGLSHDYFSTMLEAIKAQAAELEYDITFICPGKNMSYLQHCYFRGVDGVVIANINYNDAQVIELVSSDLPVVVIDHVYPQKTAVISDNEMGGRAVIQYAYNMGHRNIGLIHGELTSVTQKRLDAIWQFCSEVGLNIPKSNVKEAKFHDSAKTYFATQELLRLPNRPTCILFPDDYSYIGGLNAIHDAGLSIPEDISTIGYDGIELSRIISPPLVTYHQDAKEMGRIAIDKLVEQIDSPAPLKPEVIMVSGSIMDGGSVREILPEEN